MMKRTLIGSACALALGGAVWIWAQDDGHDDGSDGMSVSSPSGQLSSGLIIPTLGASEAQGRAEYLENCAACHGQNGLGTSNGPPLIHKIYEPSHHADFAFFNAAKNGVRAHHWNFGNMPPVTGIADEDIGRIVAYVRAVQRANGIN